MKTLRELSGEAIALAICFAYLLPAGLVWLYLGLQGGDGGVSFAEVSVQPIGLDGLSLWSEVAGYGLLVVVCPAICGYIAAHVSGRLPLLHGLCAGTIGSALALLAVAELTGAIAPPLMIGGAVFSLCGAALQRKRSVTAGTG